MMKTIRFKNFELNVPENYKEKFTANGTIPEAIKDLVDAMNLKRVIIPVKAIANMASQDCHEEVISII